MDRGGRILSALRRRRDPAPSRLTYRLSRLARRRYVRNGARVIAPGAAAVFAVWQLLTWPTFWDAVEAGQRAVWDKVVERPEFAVERLAISGASAPLDALIRREAALSFPVSSFSLDLDALRRRIEALPAVASARVTLAPPGALRVAVRERVPVALWRARDGLYVIDATGERISAIADRGDAPQLPLVVGEGAGAEVGEALALIAEAGPLKPRLRAAVRMGQRRWDLALDRDQTIMLPEKDPQAALARVLAWHYAEDLMDRDVRSVDMRNPRRPTLRLTRHASEELQRLRTYVAGEDA